jgi:hypothetical protein
VLCANVAFTYLKTRIIDPKKNTTSVKERKILLTIFSKNISESRVTADKIKMKILCITHGFYHKNPLNTEYFNRFFIKKS